MLIIMDGWGLGPVKAADAIQNANVPFVSGLYSQYPNTTLITCGEAVGLPDGQMGNSEVGHLNLGAGRIVYQELQRIHVAVRDGSFAGNPALNESIDYAINNKKNLHIIGLVSDGGVHSHTNHLKAITSLCKEKCLTNVLAPILARTISIKLPTRTLSPRETSSRRCAKGPTKQCFPILTPLSITVKG